MLKKEKIVLLLISFSISNFFALSVELKERLLTNTNWVRVSSLFLEPLNITNEIFVESKYYSAIEIAEILKKNNINDVIIVGDGIEIKVLSFMMVSQIKEKILSCLPENVEIDFANFQIESCFLFDRKNLKMSNEINSNEIRTYLEAFFSSNSVLSPTNLTFTFEVKKGKTHKEKYFLRKIKGNFYELLYIKGNISIITKVRLIKRLEDYCYIVENLNGKKLTIKVENEI